MKREIPITVKEFMDLENRETVDEYAKRINSAEIPWWIMATSKDEMDRIKEAERAGEIKASPKQRFV